MIFGGWWWMHLGTMRDQGCGMGGRRDLNYCLQHSPNPDQCLICSCPVKETINSDEGVRIRKVSNLGVQEVTVVC